MIRSEQEQVRLGSLQQLRELGINPFPAEEFIVSHKSDELRADFKEGVDPELEKSLNFISNRKDPLDKKIMNFFD